MKKLVAMLFAAALIYSCGDGDKKNEPEQTKPADTTAASTTPPAASTDAGSDDEKALTLIGSSDCMTCHSIDKKVIGPAYKDVSKKYEDTPATVDTLVAKIKHGGSGNWGNLVMTPHPDLPEADAKIMVKYILSLKN